MRPISLPLLQRDRQRATKRRPMSDPFIPIHQLTFQSHSKCRNHNDFSGQPAPSQSTVIGTRLLPDTLGDISEESGRHLDPTFSSNIPSLGWVDCKKEDLSFDSNTETSTVIASTIPATEESPRRIKSKIPLPVFKTLRRLSSTRLATIRVKDAVTISQRKKTTGKPSPTRLPIRLQ